VGTNVGVTSSSGRHPSGQTHGVGAKVPKVFTSVGTDEGLADGTDEGDSVG